MAVCASQWHSCRGLCIFIARTADWAREAAARCGSMEIDCANAMFNEKMEAGKGLDDGTGS